MIDRSSLDRCSSSSVVTRLVLGPPTTTDRHHPNPDPSWCFGCPSRCKKAQSARCSRARPAFTSHLVEEAGQGGEITFASHSELFTLSPRSPPVPLGGCHTGWPFDAKASPNRFAAAAILVSLTIFAGVHLQALQVCTAKRLCVGHYRGSQPRAVLAATRAQRVGTI